jgi:cysteine-rich repeat protein
MLSYIFTVLVFLAVTTIQLCIPNFFLDPGESCDLLHLGCDHLTCQVRPGWYCVHNNRSSGQILQTCFEVCGDGFNLGGVECDDGNVLSRDGCSSRCTVEKGFKCFKGDGMVPDKCLPICGDGLKIANEECDDGGITGGCTQNCTIKENWTCSGGD